MKLAGKTAIVTGASRGIGKAIALGFAREGANLVVAARSDKEGPIPGTIYKTAEEIEALGAQALPLKCDVTSEADLAQMVTQVLSRFGAIDILVNNAGTAFYAPFVEMPMKRWDLVMRVNLGGAVLCSKAVLPQMVKQKRGSIINVSSTAATIKGPNPSGVAYATAKAAIERFTTALAAEVAQHNIAVNCIKPAWWVESEGARYWNPKATWTWDPPQRMVASAIFLAAQDAKGVTGVVTLAEELCAAYNLV